MKGAAGSTAQYLDVGSSPHSLVINPGNVTDQRIVGGVRTMLKSLHRRQVFALAAGGLAAPYVSRSPSLAPGVTTTSIKVGQTMSYTGPAAALGMIGRGEAAVFKMLNAGGGVSGHNFDLLPLNGRTIQFLSADDRSSPPSTVEETRRLVEREGVAFMFSGTGDACQTAVRQYLNAKEVPQIFVASRMHKFGDHEHFPWTMGWQPSYRTEARIYARHMQQDAPGAKLAVLCQDSDLGREYLDGIKDQFGPAFDRVAVRTAPHDATDAAVESEIGTLRLSGADALLTAAAPPLVAQIVRALTTIGWYPSLHYVSNGAASAMAAVIPAEQADRAGLITATCSKDPTDPQWRDDPGMNEWRAFVLWWTPGADLGDGRLAYGYGAALTLKRVLEQCGDDLSRENIMRQAANLHDLELPVLLPGVRLNTSPTSYRPIQQMRLQRWTGSSWALFGEVLKA